jgi:predicted Zn finger-like uncharacterized protein
MAIISCDNCQSDNDIHLEGMGPDGSRILRCGDCGHTWSPVAVNHSPTFTRTPFEMAQGRFANAKMVDPSLLTRVNRLKTKFLKTDIEPDPAVADYYARCRELFSVEGLDRCKAQDLKDFVSNPMGANPGNVSMFSRAWKRLGEDVAADRTRASISYLLRGPETVPLEDRLSHLIEDHAGTGMPGFKEALLTKVLCVMEPERFLPILTYATEHTGKADLTLAVWGLHLPKVDLTSMQIGRLAVWSDDLLLEPAGDGFTGPQHVAEFIWWAKDRVEHTALASVR